MKIKKLHIILWISVLFCLNSVKAQSVMEPVDHRAEQLREFQTERVTAVKLVAFAKRAEQKLKDFFGYWELMLNQDYPLEMREEALETGAACFAKQAKLDFNFLGRSAKSPKGILDRAIAGKTPKVTLLDLDNSSPLIWQDGHYTGQMQFSIKVNNKTQTYLVELELQKVKKRFGNRTELIWEVELGDVKPLP
jgi:hypothetical protein